MAVDPHHTDVPAPGDVVDERGVFITAEGRQRARQLLNDLDSRRTEKERAATRAALLDRIRNRPAAA